MCLEIKQLLTSRGLHYSALDPDGGVSSIRQRPVPGPVTVEPRRQRRTIGRGEEEDVRLLGPRVRRVHPLQLVPQQGGARGAERGHGRGAAGGGGGGGLEGELVRPRHAAQVEAGGPG